MKIIYDNSYQVTGFKFFVKANLILAFLILIHYAYAQPDLGPGQNGFATILSQA